MITSNTTLKEFLIIAKKDYINNPSEDKRKMLYLMYEYINEILEDNISQKMDLLMDLQIALIQKIDR